MPDQKLLEPAPPQRLLDDPQHPRVPGPHHVSRARIAWIAIGLLALLAILFLVGYLPRRKREAGISADAQEEKDSVPVVNVAKAKRSPSLAEMLLPGNMTPVTDAYIFARASGYLKKRYVDIGDRVKEGQLLAEVDAPDLDQQVVQARANLSQTRAALGQTQASLEQTLSQQRLTAVNLERYKTLVARGVLSRQQGDQAQADYDNASANVHAAEANVRAAQDNVRAGEANVARFVELQGFKQIRAPFSGVITSRNVDVGAFITTAGASSGAGQGIASGGSSGSSASQSQALFRLAQINILRIMVNVPQSYAPSIHLGQTANVLVQEFRRKFVGRVTRTASSLDENTRTLLTEVQVQNPDRVLLPGMYAQLQLVNERPNPPLLVPGDSLVVRANGSFVAVVQSNNRVKFQPVELGRDYGTDIEITRGLQPDERVVVNPDDDVKDGVLVKMAPTKPPAAQTGAGSAQPGGPSNQGSSGIGSAAPPRNANSGGSESGKSGK